MDNKIAITLGVANISGKEFQQDDVATANAQLARCAICVQYIGKYSRHHYGSFVGTTSVVVVVVF